MGLGRALQFHFGLYCHSELCQGAKKRRICLCRGGNDPLLLPGGVSKLHLDGQGVLPE